jgi:hypothetical protein
MKCHKELAANIYKFKRFWQLTIALTTEISEQGWFGTKI